MKAGNVFAETLAGQMIMKEYIPQVLKQLSLIYKLAVVSNDPYPQNVTKTLERFDLLNFFEIIVISGEMGWRKPSPKIFKKALATL